jgi:hypothetical protein
LSEVILTGGASGSGSHFLDGSNGDCRERSDDRQHEEGFDKGEATAQ